MLKKSFVLCALLLAAASSLPLFAGEYAFHFMPPGYSSHGTQSSTATSRWVLAHTPIRLGGGSHEEFQFELNRRLLRQRRVLRRSNQVAEVFNCLTSTVATDPSISFAWSVTPARVSLHQTKSPIS